MQSVTKNFKIEQLYTNCLAEAAYYIESNGEAAIIDPLREIEPYLQKLKENGATLKYIFETHFHADFVSGHVDLAKATGATIVFGPGAQTDYQVEVATDGQEYNIGELKILVLHTPGHTLESASFLLKDFQNKPYCVFTGDTLFIGDVGRPDLAIKSNLTQEDLAGMLYNSLRNKIMPLPDHVIVYPAHGAGSACGKNISKETFSTLGQQKQTNYALQDISKQEFIKEVTSGILPPPQYFAKNALLNQKGYQEINTILKSAQVEITAAKAYIQQQKGALILDVRSPQQYAQKHIKNSLFIGLDGQFAVWVGTLIENINTPIILVVDSGREEEAVLRLSRVGYDNTIGFIKNGVTAWENEGLEIDSIKSITPEEFEKQYQNNSNVLDVRKPSEYNAEHIENAKTFPLDFIYKNLHKLNKQNSYYVHCKGGYRSMIACSILKNEGINQIIDIKGGYDAISQKTNLPKTDFVCQSSSVI